VTPGCRIVSPRLEFPGDKETVDEIAGGEARFHGAKGPEMIDKLSAMLGGKHPKGFLFDDVQTKIPGLGAVFVEYLAVDYLQVI
jgi:hypothetical protein